MCTTKVLNSLIVDNKNLRIWVFYQYPTSQGTNGALAYVRVFIATSKSSPCNLFYNKPVSIFLPFQSFNHVFHKAFAVPVERPIPGRKIPGCSWWYTLEILCYFQWWILWIVMPLPWGPSPSLSSPASSSSSLTFPDKDAFAWLWSFIKV